VEIYSGRTWRVLRRFDGDRIGADLAAIGDVDRDGCADFAFTVGAAPNFCVEAWSGRDGRMLWQVERSGSNYDDGSTAVEALGDVDADGIPDVAFAAPSRPDDAWQGGRLYVLSGVDGAERASFGDGTATGEAHESVSPIGDLDGDGCADILVRAVRGREWVVRVVSGRDGSTLREVPQLSIGYGWSVAGIGDFDGDSFTDFAVGAPTFDDSDAPSHVYVYSGRDGALLLDAEGASSGALFQPGWLGLVSFGICLKGAGDFNGDGCSDILVGEARFFGFGPGNGPDRTVVIAGGPAGPSLQVRTSVTSPAASAGQ
jgi:hypothetical protein